jgi:neutral trehalase
MMVVGLEGTGDEEGALLAREAAKRWLNSTVTAWESTGSMFEKMVGDKVGVPGHGGEYSVVKGPFGWSNSVALKFSLDYNFPVF